MEYGICLLSVAPVRSMPNDRSELVTQLLFGEMVQVLEIQDKWAMIQIVADSYQGWISKGQLTALSFNEFDNLRNQSHWVSNDLVQVLQNTTHNFSFLVSGGSSFYGCNNNAFEILDNSWHFHGNMHYPEHFEPETLVTNALMFLHTPYLWGGKSALGIDCSGFTQLVFKMAGLQLHRDASQQAKQGEMINLINEALPGDLLFFDNDEGDIIHVGILSHDMHIIHAHQKVRIDKVDHLGIFNVDTKRYSHKLRVIKRLHANSNE